MYSRYNTVNRTLAKVLFALMSLAAFPLVLGFIWGGSMSMERMQDPGSAGIQGLLWFLPAMVLALFGIGLLREVRGLYLLGVGLFATVLVLVDLCIIAMNPAILVINIIYGALWWYLVSPKLLPRTRRKRSYSWSN